MVCDCVLEFTHMRKTYVLECTHTHTHKQTHTRTHAQTHAHTYSHTSPFVGTITTTSRLRHETHTHIHTYAHTHIHTCTHAHIHTYIHTCTHAQIPTFHRMHTHPHINYFKCTPAHTHTHTLIWKHAHTDTHKHKHTCTHIHTPASSCLGIMSFTAVSVIIPARAARTAETERRPPVWGSAKKNCNSLTSTSVADFVRICRKSTCMYVCMYVYVCACVCIPINVYAHAYVYPYNGPVSASVYAWVRVIELWLLSFRTPYMNTCVYIPFLGHTHVCVYSILRATSSDPIRNICWRYVYPWSYVGDMLIYDHMLEICWSMIICWRYVDLWSTHAL
jgi:hypothetical protein